MLLHNDREFGVRRGDAIAIAGGREDCLGDLQRALIAELSALRRQCQEMGFYASGSRLGPKRMAAL